MSQKEIGVAIYTSGGDSAGMNPAIKRFYEYAKDMKLKPYLIYDGLEGLIDNKIYEATSDRVSGIVHRGGTILRSSRSKRFFEYEYRKKAFENLQSHGIQKLIVLGGDGSFRALQQFYNDFGIPFVGIPATIDNDIFGTDYCLGVDTALNIIRQAIDSLRDTASSFKRAFVIETMGRNCGYLAIVSAITSGAEVCIIPEMSYDLETLGRRLRSEIAQGRTYILAIVAEGAKASTKIVQWLKEDVGMDTRITILGHVQRGGSPTVYDRLMAFEFTTHALNKLIEDSNANHVVVYKGGRFDFVSIDYVNSGKYQIEPQLIKMAEKMTK